MAKKKNRPSMRKYPFGGIINKGVTKLASALGASDENAQKWGSGVATATGFIPGMQSNLLQGLDFIGDISNDSNMYANGGVVPKENIPELEKEEVFRTPNGQVGQVDAPTHAEGGIDVDLPQGTQVFSDRLKIPGSKITFAKAAEKYKVDKEQKILDDKKSDRLAKNSAELNMQVKHKKLSELMNQQETLKQKRLSAYAKRLGINNDNKFPLGGVVDYLPAIGGAAQMIAPIYNLATNKKVEKPEYENYNLEQFDPSQALNDVDQINNANRTMIRNVSGGNAGAYMSNIAASENSQIVNKSRVRTDYENRNNTIANQESMLNTQLNNQENLEYQQNKARKQDIDSQAIGQIGSNIAGVTKDYSQIAMDKLKIKAMNDFWKDYEIVDGKIVLKQKKENAPIKNDWAIPPVIVD